MGEVMPRAMGTEDAAHYLSLSRETFRKHVAPDIRPVRVGARVLWLREDLDIWLDRAAGKEMSDSTPNRQNPLDALL